MQLAKCRLNYEILASFLLLILRMEAVTPQTDNIGCLKGVKCRMDALLSTHLYALKVSEYHYPTLKSSSLTVKVYMTKCAGVDTLGPSWYKLEAISDETKEPVGTFEEPPSTTESYTTEDNTMIEFSTNQPNALSDLPRTYSWSKTAGNNGRICFRLTVLADDEESDKCKQTVKCILPQGAIVEGSGSGSGDSVDGYETFTPSKVNPPLTKRTTEASIPQKCQKDCSTATQGEFCSKSFEGKIFSSRCEFRNVKCLLRNRGVIVEHMEVGQCSEPSQKMKPCFLAPTSNQEGSWIPKCSCKGLYKLIQCDSVLGYIQCWCSSADTGLSVGTILSNGQRLDRITHQCTDPESYDQFSHCLKVST